MLSEELALQLIRMKSRSQPCKDFEEGVPDGGDSQSEGPGVEKN